MNKDFPKLRVYLLAYNRPTYILESLNSILEQDYPSLEIVVSDNSTSEEVQNVLSNISDPRLSYLRQQPSLSSTDHTNVILKHAISAPFFMIFHDDDKLLGGGLRELMKAFDPDTVAVGCNAFEIKNDLETTSLFMHGTKDRTAKNPTDIALPYFDSTLWHAAFPSYIYRSSGIRGLYFNIKEGGKYCDITFLMKLTQNGSIKMLVKPQMQYRLHTSKGSALRTLNDYLSLIRHIKKATHISHNKLDAYKYTFILRWAFQKKKDKAARFSKREKTLIRASISYVLLHPELIIKKIKTSLHLLKSRL